MNVSTEGLPVEMQQRIAEIIEKAKAGAAPAAQSQPPGVVVGSTPAAAMVGQQAPLAPRPPSLMDHVIALRQEVSELRNEVLNMSQQVAAAGQVTEAVGNAVGQLYQMFCQQTEPTTYSSGFQEASPSQVDDF